MLAFVEFRSSKQRYVRTMSHEKLGRSKPLGGREQLDAIALPATGTCQCQACQYEVNAQPFVCYTCHCRECQYLSSSAFNTCAQFPAECVQISAGEPKVRNRVADSGNVLSTWFCGVCGSALFSQNSARPRIRTVYVGTLSILRDIEVDAHIWVSRKLPWVVLPETHRIFETGGDWSADYARDLDRYLPSRKAQD